MVRVKAKFRQNRPLGPTKNVVLICPASRSQDLQGRRQAVSKAESQMILKEIKGRESPTLLVL